MQPVPFRRWLHVALSLKGQCKRVHAAFAGCMDTFFMILSEWGLKYRFLVRKLAQFFVHKAQLFQKYEIRVMYLLTKRALNAILLTS